MKSNPLETFNTPPKTDWPSLAKRAVAKQENIVQVVHEIILSVKQKGDQALKEYSEKFDSIPVSSFEISKSAIDSAEDLLSKDLKEAINIAKLNIEKFHSAQKTQIVKVETMPGVNCWQKEFPIEKVGIYIPGGTAPLFSTVLMLAIPAKLAGCQKIVLCSPPVAGKINPAILYAAKICGVDRIYQIGGAQAIAAMAYGTETVPQVYKIFGPGNQYVNLAKQLVAQDGVAIDLPAGPTELAIFADSSANPQFIAADFLSQLEHGLDSQVVLVTNSESLIPQVISEIIIQSEKLSRQNFLESSLLNSKIIFYENFEECFSFLNFYASEHLIIASDRPHDYVNLIDSAGSVFLGNFTPESAGDYASGTNHTLPTNFAARAWSGVNLGSFLKKITYQEITQEGINLLAPTIITMAEAEGLGAHAEAARIRIELK